ncbi:MAG: radical SAM protein [Alphaproteobacteria bacterium]|nr:radical SAM protein [Alphaproteobacteria bacterium]
MTAPRYPLEGVVSWNMNTTCNYRCSYCTQRFVDDRKQWARDLPRFVAALAALPGDWEVKLSGGEPFRHPDFLGAVEGLVAGGLRVSVVTNLSASDEALAAFAAITAPRPGVLSASLHLEYAEPRAFRDKLAAFRDRHAGSTHATCVATRELLPRLPALKALFAEAGLDLRVQPEKQDREVVAYSPAERTALVALGGHNGTGQVDPDLSGRPCWAGARYLIVDHRGEVYRCYPARRRRQERLGNLLDGALDLRPGPTPCPYAYCNCTVPQQRGMVDIAGAPSASRDR